MRPPSEGRNSVVSTGDAHGTREVDHAPADRGGRARPHHDIRRCSRSPGPRSGAVDRLHAFPMRVTADTTLFTSDGRLIRSGSELYTRNLLHITAIFRDRRLASQVGARELQQGLRLHATFSGRLAGVRLAQGYQAYRRVLEAASPEAFEAHPHLELAPACMIETATRPFTGCCMD